MGEQEEEKGATIEKKDKKHNCVDDFFFFCRKDYELYEALGKRPTLHSVMLGRTEDI